MGVAEEAPRLENRETLLDFMEEMVNKWCPLRTIEGENVRIDENNADNPIQFAPCLKKRCVFNRGNGGCAKATKEGIRIESGKLCPFVRSNSIVELECIRGKCAFYSHETQECHHP